MGFLTRHDALALAVEFWLVSVKLLQYIGGDSFGPGAEGAEFFRVIAQNPTSFHSDLPHLPGNCAVRLCYDKWVDDPKNHRICGL